MTLNFILYINCTDKEAILYNNGLAEAIKKTDILADFLDLDNFSDSNLINYAKKALEESSKASIFFNIQTNGDSKPFLSLIHFLLDHPTKFIIFVNGSNPTILKMLPSSENFIFHGLTIEQALENVSSFFNTK